MALVNKNRFGFLVNTSKMLHAIPRHCYIRLIIRLSQVATSA